MKYIPLKIKSDCNWMVFCFVQILASEVHFWDSLPHELELMRDQKMYPPRFTLQVCGDKATHDATALVEFEGACEDLSTEIHLSLPTTGMYSAHDHCIMHSFISTA